MTLTMMEKEVAKLQRTKSRQGTLKTKNGKSMILVCMRKSLGQGAS